MNTTATISEVAIIMPSPSTNNSESNSNAKVVMRANIVNAVTSGEYVNF